MKAIAFDVDAASLASLRQALPGWEVESVNGATAASLDHGWDRGPADLLVVGIRDDATDTLALCRSLASCMSFSADSRQGAADSPGLRGRQQKCSRDADAPLLVLVRPGQEALVRPALERKIVVE